MLAHRQAFPTPRGVTGGCPPEHICGGRPRGPREGGKGDPEDCATTGVYLCRLV